ncbi:SusD/RagB family nutrient-binding outer membrane lipoprotein [Chitinophaga sedimenti]|uniref:SusD/RagB family nutrient-binding outer membrane lipoprotein n=1 Tax=Chitinophaga sedimenti TaxID=2033606 RepID=UPI00249F694B|nr:SusD/RagB family nutrient-binding outer membrane lipoprotein [Chitinophaga sedimenti]
MKTRYYILALLAFVATACNDFGDLNTDPTKSSSMNPANQLIYTQLWFSGDLSTQERTNAIVLCPMMQQLGGAYYTRVGAMYIKDATRLWVMWENSYPNDVVNIVDAVQRTNGDSTKTNLNAMCRIMKVYVFARITDLYGDIPYFQAGTAYYSQKTYPEYDTQQAIYDDFLKELKAASAQLNPAKDKVPGEIFYKGDVPSWKRFANSLRIRLALRIAKRDPERAKTEITEAYNADGGLISNNNQICMTRHLDIQNTYSDLRGNSASVAINQQTASVKLVSTF